MTKPVVAAAELARPNPSAFHERLPILVLAAAGFIVATYLALYQLGILTTVWEPFFGDESERVLHSFISRLLPIPDAALGALGYAAEFIGGCLGGPHRWRTNPWLVLAYGVVVATVTLAALGLVFVQLVVIRAACTLCLTSAVISLTVGWRARAEILASLRVVRGTL